MLERFLASLLKKHKTLSTIVSFVLGAGATVLCGEISDPVKAEVCKGALVTEE